jgi:hypothetical protein
MSSILSILSGSSNKHSSINVPNMLKSHPTKSAIAGIALVGFLSLSFYAYHRSSTQSHQPVESTETHPMITLEQTQQQLSEATARRMQMIVQKSTDGLQSGDLSGIQYPWSITSTHSQYTQLKKWGYLLSGTAPAHFFDEIPEPGHFPPRVSMHFIAKEGVKPSDAIEAAIKSPMIGDCGLACQLARYAALMDVLGKPKFDKLFSTPGHRVNIGYLREDLHQPMRLFVDFTENARKGNLGHPNHRPVKVGDVVLFHGVNDYQTKHPFGVDARINAICIDATPGAQKFVGLGLDPKGMTEADIASNLLQGYNKDALHPFSLFPQEFHDNLLKNNPHQASLKTHKATTVGGYDPGSPQAFNVSIICNLINQSLDEVSMDRVLQSSF